MIFLDTEFEGVFIVENKKHKDNRGEFLKLYQKSLFTEKGLSFNVDEHFFSVSEKGVIRGMHFQKPPHAQSKLVYVLNGKVLDVLVDLRKSSQTFGKIMKVELSSEKQKAIFIPEGIAHGFQSLAENTVMVYSQSNEFNAASDSGISPLSLGIEWLLKDYLISDKDRKLTPFKKFNSPFN